MKKIQGNFHWPLLLLAGMSLAVSSCSVDGSVLFKEKGCIQCHSYKGKGGRMGPDLTAVGERLSARQIRNYIKNPSAQNPKARMPTISNLSTTEIWALASYLKKGDD
ncbi:MAG: cytochrome c [Deltaproteobacteria bacterium]